jgi:hypothetical protein
LPPLETGRSARAATIFFPMARTRSRMARTNGDGFRQPPDRRRPCGALAEGDKQGAKSTRVSSKCPAKRGSLMKLVLTLLGVVLLVIAAVYFLVPADQLPGFFPGHEDGVSRVHMKHGIVAGVIGLILIGAGTFMGRR